MSILYFCPLCVCARTWDYSWFVCVRMPVCISYSTLGTLLYYIMHECVWYECVCASDTVFCDLWNVWAPPVIVCVRVCTCSCVFMCEPRWDCVWIVLVLVGYVRAVQTDALQQRPACVILCVVWWRSDNLSHRRPLLLIVWPPLFEGYTNSGFLQPPITQTVRCKHPSQFTDAPPASASTFCSCSGLCSFPMTQTFWVAHSWIYLLIKWFR